MNTSSQSSSDRATWDVCVIGLGYVGLPTAAVLATRGGASAASPPMKIAGVDTRNDVVSTINEGRIHIVEPELDALVRAAVAAGNLRAFDAPQAADAFLICVPTPFGPGHSPDMRFVEAATRALLPVLRPGNLVVLESTSPPGTTRALVAGILEQGGFVAGRDVFVAHAPERVLPGAVIREVVENDRVVGGVTPACTEAAAAFYERFVAGEVLRCTADAAELVKLSENAFRDVNIAFANELSNVCDALDLDVWEVIRLANRHPRVNILRPGPGVGGHCIAVDPWFIVAVAPEHTPLINAARRVNDGRPHRVVAQVRTIAERFKRPKIVCLGLTYKPDIDDVRESPALEVVRELAAADFGDVVAVEPHLRSSPIEGVPLQSPEEALRSADIVVILVAHRVFARLRREWFNRPSVVDTVGLLTR
ncbi:MAG: UDP-N-acetyl-D-mannosamine dehydrogenase [Deltaproteobacteria bacterium]|jgi:UDP-N-acetyl-D-mannosaminuronic acid dehydrogenase|nr:UDP-N-acetyl-D-mannosamine dehydrogenase [Deltaproteobacteria bacterium]MBK8235193.1 UDP-N-acetyl-D-mannosamine dehydrogenase [Deltaproteobacteria bacterium]MBK8716487.1 UDP-N-acetyl-D-mannosamine dehydrogenase [Deltaproteobacteria bacterium]MBP7287323.1 UDP-N-acetyl-D-mannosamine dehydrogenase [Nannocystaceae bacterium]